MYSSITEEQRSSVIEKCYWPILRLAEEWQVPVGLELSGITAEIISQLDIGWINKFKQLLHENKIELLGSGLAQIIGPLVPAEVNAWNQKLGMEIYKKIFGLAPNIAWINEQAYSAGIVEHYLNVGYQAIIMEWNNSFRYNRDWQIEWQYIPQFISCNNQAVPIIWNNSIWFQKFQRYAQGESELNEYLEFLNKHLGEKARGFALYGSDAEVFDYRPGRYQNESAIEQGEWERIKKLYQNFKNDVRFNLILPSATLSMTAPESGKRFLTLETAEQPISVKKQEKYNITRWAVTGRDSTSVNTRCFKIYQDLTRNKVQSPDEWRRLCYFWSSDFRTHIEEKRWHNFLRDLNDFEQKKVFEAKTAPAVQVTENFLEDFKVEKRNSKISVDNDLIRIVLDCRKGLAIDSLIFKSVSSQPLIGTLAHGYYEDIAYGADFFSGHTIIEIPGRPKITDLANVEPVIEKKIIENDKVLSVGARIDLAVGSIVKEITVNKEKPQITLEYQFDLQNISTMSLRTGIITLIPSSYDAGSLYYQTTNGGKIQEKFRVNRREFNHGRPISVIVSASQCLGATDNFFEIGDDEKSLIVYSDKAICYNVPMLQFQNVDKTYFFRAVHSLREIDETCQPIDCWKRKIKFILTARKNIL
jgi:hypothetical protein